MLFLKAKALTFRERLKHLSSLSQCGQHFSGRDKFVSVLGVGLPVPIEERYFWSTSHLFSFPQTEWEVHLNKTDVLICIFIVLVSRYFFQTWMNDRLVLLVVIDCDTRCRWFFPKVDWEICSYHRISCLVNNNWWNQIAYQQNAFV